MNYTLITGASNGIGKEMAVKCASMKRNVLLISLPNENVGNLAKELSDKFSIQTDFFECNLTEVGIPEKILNWTKEKGYNVDFLINNAGFGGVAIFETHTVEYIRSMLDLNVRATTVMTSLFIPMLKDNKESYLLNTSSMAANFPLPYKAMYAASKIYIKNLTLGLREELKQYNVNVCLLQPGATPTNDTVKSQITNGGSMAKISVLSAEEVAAYAIERTIKGKALAIPGFKNRVSLTMVKLLPLSVKMKMAIKAGKSMLAEQ